MSLQRTLKSAVTFKGIGVHNGQEVALKVLPAQANHGIVFKRIDKQHDSLIGASYDRVVDTQLCTAIQNEAGVKVSTIEHLMSALWGMEIDNALIEVDADEVPIMDGSSKPFVEMFKKAGTIELEVKRKYIKVLREVVICDGDKFVKLMPDEEISYKCSIAFPNNWIGSQEVTFSAKSSNYEEDISQARTFAFVKDIEKLKSMGLARGGSLENAIGIDDNGVLNPEGLRCDNEFACHKLLDLIGDLYLAGHRIVARIEGHKCGHYLNNMVLRSLFANPSSFCLI